ncbi:transcriptional regulator [Enterococcus sp. HMSC29A04]|uniref:AraC family transcriptional regulator n=1 Tax=Enterococcus TaxID=1350 RepID=UPI0007F55EF1|nr:MULTISPECIES: AraC family transcriptional regulator [Enterococcus]SBA07529.1 AraC family transcriptional regulator [Enterococcus faecium]MDT2570134.1 AraC family transcriptional regulator [Enterococcus raffinosus]OFT87657.1 transcriptional regulator [Enterococcus sp. HMSC29A04]OFU59006.1 transcriptional regulator [Enterococcus sp. HMSC14A10]QXJ61555.1 helix-turn-helix domain-containing protein [Enterococcus raffinosus]
MDKNEIRKRLTAYTETELALLKPSDSKEVHSLDDENFSFVLTEAGQKVYLYTYEKHLESALKKDFAYKNFLESSQVIILKHARHSYTPFHMHDFIEMSYVYSGNVEMIINEEKVQLNKGAFCLLDTEVIHRIMETSEEDILINLLMKKEYFSSRMLSRLASNSTIAQFAVDALSETQKHDQFIVFEALNNEFLLDAMEGLLSHYFDPSTDSHEIIDAYMIIIFSELLRSFQKKQAQESRNANEFYIGDILDYMEKNYMNCSLKEVAEHFGYNPSYLSRMIHRQVGKSFISIIQEIKLNHASLLLRNSNLPVEQIIQQVGYKNLSFFYKIFYEKFALSPNDYRQSIS